MNLSEILIVRFAFPSSISRNPVSQGTILVNDKSDGGGN